MTITKSIRVSLYLLIAIHFLRKTAARTLSPVHRGSTPRFPDPKPYAVALFRGDRDSPENTVATCANLELAKEFLGAAQDKLDCSGKRQLCIPLMNRPECTGKTLEILRTDGVVLHRAAMENGPELAFAASYAMAEVCRPRS